MIPSSNVAIEDFYPYSYTPRARYGEGLPAHPQIEAMLAKGLGKYEVTLQSYTRFVPELLQIGRSADPGDLQRPYWINGFLPGLDAVVLYGMLAQYRPRTYCEVGSGHSTRFAEQSRRLHSPETRFISIDPAPRADVRGLCQSVIEAPLQACDPKSFSTLTAGDILFVDGSHRVLQNSDVSVFFLEILPVIEPGVIIHVHDICWPYDYPSHWARRMYSEQYMLGLLLLFAQHSVEVLMPNAYISGQPQLRSVLDELWTAPHLKGIESHGCSFWFTKR